MNQIQTMILKHQPHDWDANKNAFFMNFCNQWNPDINDLAKNDRN